MADADDSEDFEDDGDFPEDVARLMAAADLVGHGEAQVSLLEEAVRLADAAGHLPSGYAARLDLIDAATFSDRSDLVLATFPWCLAQADRDPEQFDGFSLLWRYKYAADKLPSFAEVGRGEIDRVLDDFQRRSEAYEPTPHPALTMRWKVAMLMGENDRAEELRQQFTAARRGTLSDCRACVENMLVEHHARRGEDEAALAAAEPMVAGRMKCGEVPHYTYGHLLRPLLRLGRPETAALYYRRARKLIEGKPGFEAAVADHLLFLGLTGNTARGLATARRHLAASMASPDRLQQLQFLRAVRFLVEQADRAGQPTVRLPLPKKAVPPVEGGRPTAAALAWLTTRTDDLAAQFDARNGNSFYRGQLEEMVDLHTMVRPLPL